MTRRYIDQLISDHAKMFTSVSGITHYYSDNPPEPDDAVIFTITPSFPPDPAHLYDISSLQVLVRSSSVEAARSYIWDLYNELHGLHSISLSGIFIVDTQAVQTPFALGRDPQSRAQYAFNILIQHDRIE